MSGKDPLFEQFGKVVPAGETIFHEDDEGESMYLIRKGKVRIFKTFLKDDSELADGEKLERDLVTLENGDFFGEMSLLNQEPRAATAVTIDESEVLVINREIFESMVKTNGNFALKIISKLCERVKNTDEIIEEILIHHKQRQIISKIIDLEEKHNNKIPYNRLETLMQANSKLTKENISEIIRKLEKYNIIEFKENIITIIDIENLKKVKAFLEA